MVMTLKSPGDEAGSTELARQGNFKWLVWASLLVALYLVIGIVGWNRTLIPDEVRPLLLAARPISDLFELLRMDLLHTPLSFLLYRGWLELVGQTDSAVKILALLLNIPTLMLFTWLASRYTPHWRLAAFLFSAPFLRIGSAVNLARMYGLLVLLTVIALVIWERWRKKPNNGALLAWTIVMTLLVYTHGSGLLLLPAFVATNWFYGPRRWAFASASLVPLLFLLPWIIYVAPSYHVRNIHEDTLWINQNPISALKELPFFILSGEDAGGGSPTLRLHDPHLRTALVWAAIAAHAALIVLAGRKIYRIIVSSDTRSNDQARLLCIATLICGLPVMALLAYSYLFHPALHARYVLLGGAGYWLLIVLLGQFGGKVGRVVTLGVFVPWVLVSAGLIFAQNLTPPPIRHATSFLARESLDADLILCDRHMPLGWQVYWEWTRRFGKNPAQVETLPTFVPAYLDSIVPAKPLDKLDLANTNRVWFLHLSGRLVRTVSEFLAARGFTRDKAAGSEIPSLLVFTRNQVFQPGFKR